MADLKPIGSEKLQGQDKINRILEIARYKENKPSNINETSRVEFGKVLADGNEYEIVKEKLGYVIKKKINESLDYIEPMKNRKYYRSYSQALKRMNLMAGEVNRLTENTEEVSMYQVDEQKKFTLKLPKSEVPAEPTPELPPAVEPSDEMPMDMDSELDMDMSLDTPDGEEEVSMDAEMDSSEPGMEEEVDFKVIQKLTGKLGQKIRMMNDSVGMSSEDVKYVINSILSALDLNKLDAEDKEDVIAKIEEEETDYDMDMDMGMEASDDSDMDMDMDMNVDSEEATEGEMYERDDFDGRDSEVIGVYSNIKKQRNEMSEEERAAQHVNKIMDGIFGESKVDKVLSKYFMISESEKKENEKKFVVLEKVKNLSESVEQELAAEFILKENSSLKFLGKTNKNNLVFASKSGQFKISPKGELL